MKLHILRDPAAYLCLDHSIACSRLDSLVARVRTALERRDQGQGFRLPRITDPAKWKAFDEGTPEPSPQGYGGFEIEVRRTERRLIIGKL